MRLNAYVDCLYLAIMLINWRIMYVLYRIKCHQAELFRIRVSLTVTFKPIRV
jgi:hypothetical protein